MIRDSRTAHRLTEGPHSFRTLDGATLTYFVNGHGSRLLFNVAPGWGAASVLYQKVWEYLDDDFTVVHLEVRGTRGSTFPDDPSEMSSWHMAEDLESLRMHLGVETLETLAGHSNGATIAMWYAIRYPTHVQRLISIDGQLLGSGAASWPATQALLDVRTERNSVAAFLNWAPARLETDDEFAASLAAFLPLYLADPARHLATLASAFSNTPQVACIKSQFGAESQHADQAAQLGKITAHTLVLVGRSDFITPVPVSKAIADGIKRSELHIFENSGHFPFVEQPTEFASVLKTFYDEARATSAVIPHLPND